MEMVISQQFPISKDLLYICQSSNSKNFLKRNWIFSSLSLKKLIQMFRKKLLLHPRVGFSFGIREALGISQARNQRGEAARSGSWGFRNLWGFHLGKLQGVGGEISGVSDS